MSSEHAAAEARLVAIPAAAAMPGENPFIGLRHFTKDDWRFFKGRLEHVGEVMHRLGKHHFVAVVGLSGCGKSSLVQAGLIPQLLTDRLIGTGSHWLVATSHPGGSPQENLAAQLIAAVKEQCRDLPETWSEKLPQWESQVREELAASTQGLTDVIDSAPLPDTMRFLVVIDQFEELFRYETLSGASLTSKMKNEREAFIYQLLRAAEDPSGRVFVVITMRSNYLGHCAEFEGLAEAVNEGLYLTPRLSYEQLTQAIEEPARLCAREIDPALVNLLLHDIADDQDQLPVLQHTLRQCWIAGDGALGAEQYKDAGGRDALNNHLERVIAELRSQPDGELRVKIAELAFKRLTKPGPKEGSGHTATAHGTRDASDFKTLCEQIGPDASPVDPEMVREVLDVFRSDDRAFLRPLRSAVPRLKDDTVIDITHESLIRKWERLSTWVDDESKAVEAYTDLRWIREVKGSLTAGQTVQYLNFVEQENPEGEATRQRWSRNWARRYFVERSTQSGAATQSEDRAYARADDEYSAVVEYLRDSQKELARSEQEKLRERTRHERKKLQRWMWGAGIVGGLAVLGAAFFYMQQRNDRQVLTARNETLEIAYWIDRAADNNLVMEQRVPEAIAALVRSQGDESRESYLASRIRLDQWERFSALLTPDADDLNQGLRAPGARLSEGGIAVHKGGDGDLIALADGHSVAIWRVEQGSPVLLTGAPNRGQGAAPDYLIPGARLVVFSSDGSRLAVVARAAPPASSAPPNAASPEQVHVFRIDGRMVQRLEFPRVGDFVTATGVVQAGFAAESNALVVVSKTPVAAPTRARGPGKPSGLVTLYDDSGTATPLAPAPDLPTEPLAKISSDGRYLVVPNSIGATVYDLSRPNEPGIQVGRPPAPVTADVAFLPPSWFSFIRSASNRPVFGSANSAVTSIGFLGDGTDPRMLVVGTVAGSVLVGPWLEEGDWRDVQGLSGPVQTLATTKSNGSVFIAAATQREITLLEWKETGGRPTLERAHVPQIKTLKDTRALQFVDDSTLVGANLDGKAYLFEISTGREIGRIPHDQGVVFASMIGSSGVISASTDAALKWTSWNAGNNVPFVQSKPFPGACGDGFASAFSSGDTEVWACAPPSSPQSGATKPALAVKSGNLEPWLHEGLSGMITVSSDRGRMAWVDQHEESETSTVHSLGLSPLNTQELRSCTIPGTPGPGRPVAISADGLHFATVAKLADRQQILVFRSTNEDCEQFGAIDITQREVSSLAVNPDGAILMGLVGNDLTGQKGQIGLLLPNQDGSYPGQPEPIELEGQDVTVTATALAWVEGAEPRFVAALSDGTLHLRAAQPSTETPALLGSATCLHDFSTAEDSKQPKSCVRLPSESGIPRLVVHNGRVGLFAGTATLFARITDAGFGREVIHLQEPGAILALVLRDAEHAVSTVYTSDRMLEINHTLDVHQHANRVCVNQPEDKMKEIADRVRGYLEISKLLCGYGE